jgi:benzoyl-CoA reductase/2-hydroxyglutaryl-CoA dehydratase subunit BcrC/BadD/HgdB
MAEEEKKQEDKPDLKTMLKKLSAGSAYRKMMAAHEEGKPIVFATAAVPVEIFYAMGLYPIFPESLAAISSGIKKADEFFEIARERGYSPSVCSYTRCGLGIRWLSKCAFGPIPEPDIYIGDINLCGLHVSWWRYLQEDYKKPTFFLDQPALSGDSEEHQIEFYMKQTKELVKFLEDSTGTKLDYDKLVDAVKYSDIAGLYWKKVMELRKHKPSPASFRNLAGQILPIVTFPGASDAAEFYRALYEYYKEQMEQGISPATNEKHRLMWLGIPIWHALHMINYFEEQGASFVYEPYTSLSWGNKVPSGRLDPSKPYRTLAEKYYMMLFNNNTLQKRIDILAKAVEDYDIDGVVMFNNRSCRPQSIGQDLIGQALKEKYNISTLTFEGDMGDPESFDWNETKNRIDTFLQVLDS